MLVMFLDVRDFFQCRGCFLILRTFFDVGDVFLCVW